MLIIWDVDDVLNGLMLAWFSAWRIVNGVEELEFADLTENPPSKLLGVSPESYYQSLDHFRNSEKAKRLTPNPLLLQWFRQYGHNHTHIALTARPMSTMANQAWWLYRYFGGWIHTLGVVPPSRDQQNLGRFKNKAEYIKWLGKGDVFVDDSLMNVADVADVGIKTYLYPQPWNGNQQSEAEFVERFTEDLKS